VVVLPLGVDGGHTHVKEETYQGFWEIKRKGYLTSGSKKFEQWRERGFPRSLKNGREETWKRESIP